MMLAVVEIFRICSVRKADFLPLGSANAKASRALEPEHRRFEVCVNEVRPNKVLLHEGYSVAAAFHSHFNTRRFLPFNDEIGEMIVSKETPEFSKVAS